MATDIFLKIPGIKGESKDEKHKDEMEISDWAWSFTQTTTLTSGGGGGTAKVTMEGIEFGKFMDLATPTLALNCCTGQPFANAILTQRKAGGKEQLEYLIITMTNVIVSSISHSSSGEQPTEKLKLGFASFKISYTEQNEEGGADKNVEQAYDLKKNKVL